MKELDKAIINDDVEHIRFLLQEDIDCKGAVLIHLKDKLVPDYFSIEALKSRGAILTEKALRAAIDEYQTKNQFNYRDETYLKRLYFGLQKALEAWQRGDITNKDLAQSWDQNAIDHLRIQWASKVLKESLKKYADHKQEDYVKLKYTCWQNSLLETTESTSLDDMIQMSLSLDYWVTNVGEGESHDSDHITISKQIKPNVIEQLLMYYKDKESHPMFVKEIQQFFSDRIMKQIYDGSINKEVIKDILEEQKCRFLGDKVAHNQTRYYKLAVKSLLTDKLEENWEEMSIYMKKYAGEYQTPGKLKAILLDKATYQLLNQYKKCKQGDTLLSSEVVEDLEERLQVIVEEHYEKSASKDTAFRQELTQVIFTELLKDWRDQKLTSEQADYLQNNLLSEVQDMLKAIRPYVLRSEMFLQVARSQEELKHSQEEIKSLKEELMLLKKELMELKQQKPAIEKKAKGKERLGSDPLIVDALPKFGVFKETNKKGEAEMYHSDVNDEMTEQSFSLDRL